MHSSSKKIRIAVTGPESTGKTTLSKQLAEYFNGAYIPEMARFYVEQLPHPYTYRDVETIARMQLEQYQTTLTGTAQLFVFDTWLIITKVWFNWVFNRVPDWLDHEIRQCPVDLFLLCLPDLPWVADPVRENGGENRFKLLELYRKELLYYGFDFFEVSGVEEQRLESALRAIHHFYPHLKV